MMQNKFKAGDIAYLRKELEVHGIIPFLLFKGAPVTILGTSNCITDTFKLYSIRVTNPRNGKQFDLEDAVLESHLYSENEKEEQQRKDDEFLKMLKYVEKRRKEINLG